ncbi:cation diffusion facilitator family transporter [Boudabousia marimammalium]|uniref:Cobalt transporter n=1 Tax=Boudabousia marimammalium TaxID=156892 RepID=A0A1Q5PL36_9ACTO|nr:cation transporter [Boudabousia marimammalium]OKL47346.1 cobalt transporter [Boudabousia marimammalium]
MSTVTVSPSRKSVLERRIRLIVSVTIGWNIIEAIVAITAGGIASSSALIAFGLDSLIEVMSAFAVGWQFSSANPEARERIALKVIAISFFGLAAYVGASSVLSLAGYASPEHSLVGIILASLSLIVMPLLSAFERKTGRELGSATAVADSQQTLICAYLSAAVLVGLLLNSVMGWTWADPLAALVISIVALREGVEAWRGEVCCKTPGGCAA